MPSGKQAVPEVSSGEHNRATDRKQPVGYDTEAAMCHGRADNEQAKPRKCGDDDARFAVPRVADADGNDTQRNREIKHLCVQVAFGERHQHRQGTHKERQREAVQQAQAGEPDRGAVEPVR